MHISPPAQQQQQCFGISKHCIEVSISHRLSHPLNTPPNDWHPCILVWAQWANEVPASAQQAPKQLGPGLHGMHCPLGFSGWSCISPHVPSQQHLPSRQSELLSQSPPPSHGSQ